jgi:3-hydroxyacyl-CoA dehydrogenase/enoyl-CoA hydratase/3-hydroxybutyryl-CoA epimerase
MIAFKLTKNTNGTANLVFDLKDEKINKLSAPVLLELEQMLDGLAKETDIKLLIIESAKNGIFIAGADIEEIKDLREEADAIAKVKRGQDVLTRIEKLPFPALALINGACMGGGMELALACKYIVTTDNPKCQLALPEVNLGIFPGFGGTQRMPKRVGLVQGLTLVTSGKSVDGKKAEKIGLADTCIPEGYLGAQLPEFINAILSGKYKRNRKESLMDTVPFLRSIVYKKTRAEILKGTKGHYPAPIAALDVIERTFKKTGLEEGMRIEREEFAKVCIGDICKNLIQVFYTSEALKKEGGKSDLEIKHAALLGAGVMGGGIAWAFTKAGIPVRMKDVNWNGVGLGFSQVSKIYSSLKKIKKARPEEVDVKMNLVSGTLDYSGFKNADIVVEAIVEDINVKKKVLAEVEGQIPEHAIIASNTSSLSITQMASALKRPQNFVGMHFFNPVNRMPLVEVIAGKDTSPAAVAAVFALSRKMGKTPIKVGDCAGFVVNRILLPYMNEAVLMLEQGVSIARMDEILFKFGMPMGPFTLADEVGIDVCYKVAKVLHDAYGDRVVLSDLLRSIYQDKKLLGKKAGLGFYDHKGERKLNADLEPKEDNKKIDAAEVLDRCILLMVNEAAMCVEENMVDKPEFLDMAMIMGTGFPPFRGGLLRYADAIGIKAVVERLNQLETLYGKRFKPAAILVNMAGSGKKFYS